MSATGQPISKLMSWEGETGVICVHLDANGQVRGKLFNALARESYLGVIQRFVTDRAAPLYLRFFQT